MQGYYISCHKHPLHYLKQSVLDLDLFLENQEYLLPRVNTFKDAMTDLEDAILRNDKEKLIALLTLAKTERDRWMP